MVTVTTRSASTRKSTTGMWQQNWLIQTVPARCVVDQDIRRFVQLCLCYKGSSTIHAFGHLFYVLSSGSCCAQVCEVPCPSNLHKHSLCIELFLLVSMLQSPNTVSFHDSESRCVTESTALRLHLRVELWLDSTNS